MEIVSSNKPAITGQITSRPGTTNSLVLRPSTRPSTGANSVPSSDLPKKTEEDDLFTDSENSDDEDNEEDGANGNKKKKFNLTSYFRKKQRKMVKMLMDYGPPYTKMESGITLLDECALPEPSLFEIHTMLNARLNPNYRDPEDYYNTCMHWCARHAHYRPMKLLRHAKADINLKNEFGHTPLHVICMMIFPEDKRKRQLKTFNYMLEQGAEINIRDKGGYCPIDYAAMNGHEAMVGILLERGAEVLRTNHIFVGNRQPLLHIAVGDISRKLIKDRIDDVMIENQIATEIAREEQAQADDIKKLKKRHQRIARKRAEKFEKKDQLKELKYHQQREDEKHKKMNDEYLKQQEEKERLNQDRHGRWIRSMNADGRWLYEQHDRPGTSTSKNESSNSGFLPPINQHGGDGSTTNSNPPERYLGYNANLKTMHELREKYDFNVYNARWKKKTGNNLEIEWKKNEIFVTNEDEDDRAGSAAGRRGQSREGDDMITTSLDIYNENDKELQNEDINDLLHYI